MAPGVTLTFAWTIVVFGGCADSASFKREIFLLEPGYQGPFIAIYGQAGGLKPERRGREAIYRVPRTGVLRIDMSRPGSGIRTSHYYAEPTGRRLRNYHTCIEMRLLIDNDSAAVCWAEIQVGGTNIPYHLVATVTDRANLRKNYERTQVVLDSVLFKGSGRGKLPWREPDARDSARAKR